MMKLYPVIDKEGISRFITDLDFDGIDHSDFPKYCDAFISQAYWADTGIELTIEELDDLEDRNQLDFIYEVLEDYLH